MGVFLYAGDVAPGGGGFTVWEESHRRLWLANPECTGSGHYNAEGGQAQRHGRDYHRVRELLLAGDSAVELTGPAGTLVFWHHREPIIAGIWVAFFSRCQRYRCRQESLKNALKFMLKDQFAATAATIAGLVFA